MIEPGRRRGMKVRDIGMKEMHCAKSSTDLSEIASMMKRHNVGVIPVCQGNHLLGVLTDRDLVISCLAADMPAKGCKAREYMTSNPVTVAPETDLEEAARIMGREQIHRLPVIEADKLVGMVSLGDIALALIGNDKLIAETLRKVSTPTHAVPV